MSVTDSTGGVRPELLELVRIGHTVVQRLMLQQVQEVSFLLQIGADDLVGRNCGDTEGDEYAARYAGIPFIWASYGFGKAKSPDRVIRSIKELVLINLSETYIN